MASSLRCAALAGGVLALVFVLSSTASAGRLEVAADAPWWVRFGADALLYLHIGGGTLGLLSGSVALLSAKGGRIHRLAGNVFFVSMLVMAAIGGAVAPFLADRISTVAGVLTFYLVFTGWTTARRREGVGLLERAGFLIAAGGAIATATLTWMASRTPEGTLDGAPPQAFYIFLTVSTIAALGDLKLVLRGGISGAQRVARHIWRMCFGLFVASGSLFLGQQQVFPDWLRETPVLYIAALAPLPFLLFWMLRVRLAKFGRSLREPAARLSRHA